ncbi:MAG: carboxylesterase family protein, partial [Paracoccaceae bacterium]
ALDALATAPVAEIMGRLLPTIKTEDTLFDLDSLFYPCVDPEFTPLDPFRSVRAGALDGMEMMLGYTNYEAGLWLLWDDQLDQRPPEWMAERLTYLTPAVQAALPQQYRQWYPDTPEGKLGMHILGDCCFAMPITWFADEAAKAGAKVWLYRLDRKVDERFGAMHAGDLPFFFDRPNTPEAADLIGPAADAADARGRQQLADTMAGALLGFVRFGVPKIAGGPDWSAFDQKSRATMIFDQPVSARLAEDPNGERRIWWTDAVYAPMMG